ncbi:MAG: 3-hydroxybenzoate 6-monooxygenase [Pseudomonadota bacterium]
MPEKNVVIAGGGIGGLAAALALARKGIATVVCEQASAFGEIGAGIQIAPNAFHCFDRLGIGDQARRGAVYVDKLRLMDGLNGQEICHIPLGDEFRAHFGNPYAVVHRADLHQALLDACRETGLVDLCTRSEVTGYKQSSQGVIALLANGDGIQSSALIGADGLHSKVRQQVIGDGPPRVSGHTTYRSVIPTDKMPEDLRWNAATLWAGPKCHIVHYPLKGGEVFNLVVTYHNDVTEPVAGMPVAKDEVRRGFEHIHPRAQQVIEHGNDWKLWVLCDRDPNENWVDGNVALLGDAAHPMLQYFAQGACMALEDAVVLADCFSCEDDIATALQAYRGRRFARTSSVQMGSRLIGDHIYHPSAGQAAMRDAIMSAKSPDDWNRELNWLYSDAALSAR